MVASLDPAYFEEVYARVQLGSSGGVALVGQDRGVRAAWSAASPRAWAPCSGRAAWRRATISAPKAAPPASSTVDGLERLYAYRAIAGYPLTIFVYTGSREALDQWRIGRDITFALAAALSGLVVALLALLGAGLRRQERNNEALRVSEMQAQAASRAKSEFLAAISHELRTPLTSIRGFAELMERRIEQPVFRDQASMIRKGAEHLNTLLTEILDLTKVEAGAMPIVREPQDIRRLWPTSASSSRRRRRQGLALAVRVATTCRPR